MSRFSPTFVAAAFALGAVWVAGAAANAAMQSPIRALPAARVSLGVHLPLHNRRTLDALIANQVDPRSPMYRHFLTPAQFMSSFGPTARDRFVTTSELMKLGFTVDAVTQHDVLFHGSARAVEAAFRTTVVRTQFGRGHVSTHPASQPESTPALAAIGAVVFHNARIVLHRTHSRIAQAPSRTATRRAPDSRYGPERQEFWFDDLKQAYSYPSYKDLTGKGRTIGILMGEDFLDSDLQTYFAHEHLKAPTVHRRPVDGGAPFNPNSNLSFEISLDVQQSGGMAPNATIVTYNMPDLTDQSIYDGFAAIVDDNRADIVSSSFGGAELYYTKPYQAIFGVSPIGPLLLHDLFVQGSAQGISFVASSGDNGAVDGVNILDYLSGKTTTTHFLASVESPASDPLVTGVGGTNLQTISRPDAGLLTGYSYSLDSTYKAENAFGDPLVPLDLFNIGSAATGGIWGSGGGESIFFSRPSYQNGFNPSRARAVPDLSGHMGGCPFGETDLSKDPQCASGTSTERSTDILAFDVAVVGGYYGVVGTSASAPDFAGLLALTEEHLGTRLGPVNPLAYSYAAPGSRFHPYRSDIAGFNGFSTKPGYDEVLGLGSVIGNEFAQVPGSVAGLPRSATNP